jgi:hypothetical protein
VASIIGDDELVDKQSAIDETFAQYNDYLEQLASDGDEPAPAEKRGPTMYHITNPIEFSKRVLAGEPTALTRPDLFAEMQKRADDLRRPDETPEQSFSRFAMTTDEGRALYAAYRVLPESPRLLPHWQASIPI